MSMDPHGTNLIIHQQIKEWHAVVEGERDARLDQGHADGARIRPRHALALRRARHEVISLASEAAGSSVACGDQALSGSRPLSRT